MTIEQAAQRLGCEVDDVKIENGEIKQLGVTPVLT